MGIPEPPLPMSTALTRSKFVEDRDDSPDLPQLIKKAGKWSIPNPLNTPVLTLAE